MKDAEGETAPLLPGALGLPGMPDLVAQRQAAGLSQTEAGARRGTSQSAVARLEAGLTDVRTSTLERYAAAVGGAITWKLHS